VLDEVLRQYSLPPHLPRTFGCISYALKLARNLLASVRAISCLVPSSGNPSTFPLLLPIRWTAHPLPGSAAVEIVFCCSRDTPNSGEFARSTMVVLVFLFLLFFLFFFCFLLFVVFLSSLLSPPLLTSMGTQERVEFWRPCSAPSHRCAPPPPLSPSRRAAVLRETRSPLPEYPPRPFIFSSPPQERLHLHPTPSSIPFAYPSVSIADAARFDFTGVEAGAGSAWENRSPRTGGILDATCPYLVPPLHGVSPHRAILANDGIPAR